MLITGNHWTVFNGAGAVVCDNMPLDVARAYLTPERFARGWTAVYCIVVRDPADFPAGVSASDQSVSVSVLRQHWLRAMECDHETRQDKPHCSCSRVDLGWHPSIGAAVEAWLAHVAGVAPCADCKRKLNPQDWCLNCPKWPAGVAETPAPQPVAWRVKKENGWWVYFEDRPNWHYENGYEVEPLFTAGMGREPDEDTRWSIDRAADFLEQYAAYIHRVKPEDIEQHPHLPELEMVAQQLRHWFDGPSGVSVARPEGISQHIPMDGNAGEPQP